MLFHFLAAAAASLASCQAYLAAPKSLVIAAASPSGISLREVRPSIPRALILPF